METVISMTLSLAVGLCEKHVINETFLEESFAPVI